MKKNKVKKKLDKIDYSGCTEELKEFIKDNFVGNNVVRFLISERGNQRIEIEDLDTKEIWQTLEALNPVSDKDNFDEISFMIASALMQQGDL